MVGLQPLREGFSGVCIPSAAKAGDQYQLLTYGLKPVPFNGQFLDRFFGGLDRFFGGLA
jgi:hypothetical protein